MKSDFVITSGSNPVIKLARSLRQRKKRDESGLFLVEGIHNVGVAVSSGWNISSILYSHDLLKSSYANNLIDEASALGTNCQPTLAEIFNSVADKENPQGIMAIVQQRRIQLDEIETDTFKWGVAAIQPQDPGNVGSILRTIDCVGADGLFLLDGGVDAYHPTSVRASMGALFWKPVIQASFSEFKVWAHTNGYALIGSSSHAERDYRTVSLGKRPSILILGNEQKGMTPEQINACDEVISLPMHGQASSLNLSVAAGILLYSMLG